MDAQHMSIDGGRVDVSAPRDFAVTGHTSSAEVVLKGDRRYFFTSGPPEHGLAIAGDPEIGVVNWENEHKIHGGRFRVGWSELVPDPDGIPYMVIGSDGVAHAALRWFALWEGEHSSLHYQTEGHMEADRLVAAMTQFQLEDSPTGVSMRWAAGDPIEWFNGPTVAKWLRGYALLEIHPLTPEVSRGLPRWEGTRVAGGELFIADESSEQMYLVLVGTKSATWIIPDGHIPTAGHIPTRKPSDSHLHVTEDTLIGIASELKVEWS